MPVDPTISLAIQPPSGPLTGNPLALATGMTSLANTQQEMAQRSLTMQTLQNQIQQFQQVFGARQRLGQILSSAPDLLSGIDTAQKDSVVMTQPSVVNEARELYKTLVDTATSQKQQQLISAEIPRAQAETYEALAGAGARQAEAQRTAVGMGQDIYHNLNQALLGAVGDPLKAPQIARTFKSMLPPDVAQSKGSAIDDYVRSLMPDPMLPPDQQISAFAHNFTSRYIGSGGDPKMLVATPQIGAGPGGVPNVEGVPPLLGPAAVQPGTANPLVSGGGQQPAAPGASGSPAPPPGAPPPRLAGDGKPLLTGLPPVGTTAGSGVGLQGGAAKALLDQHNGEDRMAYQQAQSALGTIDEMKADLQTLGRYGGMLGPGAGGDIRVGFAKSANALSAVLGGKAVYPPEVVAAAEDLKKNSFALGAAQAKTLLPGQKEGVQTIEESIEAVPGVNNTVLGGLLVADSRGAMLRRMIDQWEFRDHWQSATGGDLIKADEAFNRAHPARDYTTGVLDGYGLGPKGFKTPADVGKAYQQNMLTYKQAQDILHDQFKMKPAGTGQ